MIGFSSVKFVFLMYLVQFSSQETKITKCLKTPDTWKKVDKVIKECQEDVKFKIITDVLQSNNDDWDDTFFDHDDHFAWNSDGHEQHSLIVDHHPSIVDHHPSIADHHPQTHDQHPSIVDHYPEIHDHHSSIHDHDLHHQIHHNPIPDHHHPQIHDYHPQIHDHHSPTHDHHSSSHDHNPSFQVHNPSIHGHHSPTYDHHSNDHYPSISTVASVHRSQPIQIHPTHSPIGHDFPHDQHHTYDAHQIEAPQLKIRQLLSQSTRHKSHPPREHLQHVGTHTMGSLSDNPVEHIDFNDFRKKRDANDHEWLHPSTVTYHDKRIAGCIMQCIYEKNHAVDKLGWPTLDGLVNFYSEGVNEHGYFMATLRAVDHCLKGSSAKYHVNRRSEPEKGQTCDVAFDVFDCISDKITEYCSDHQHHTDSS